MRPTRTRYTVVAFMVTLAMVTYLDRACIGVMAHLIRADLKLSIDQMGHVFSAFALAYALFEIPTAWWADRRDTRSILAHIAIWRSVFAMTTAGAFLLRSMVVTRFLFGAGVASIDQRDVNAVAERLREHGAEFQPTESDSEHEDMFFHDDSELSVICSRRVAADAARATEEPKIGRCRNRIQQHSAPAAGPTRCPVRR